MYLFNIPVGQVREKITVIFSKLNNPASLGRCVGLKINTKSRGTQRRLFAVNNTGSVWLSLFFRFDGVSAIFVNWNLQILFEDDEFKRVNIRRQLIFLPNWHYIRSRFIDGLFSVFHRCTGSNFYPVYWIAYPTKQSDAGSPVNISTGFRRDTVYSILFESKYQTLHLNKSQTMFQGYQTNSLVHSNLF